MSSYPMSRHPAFESMQQMLSKMPPDSVWKRKRHVAYGEFSIYTHVIGESFEHRADKNIDLDIDTKVAASKVSQSVVCLESRSREKLVFLCSGTIIESEEESNKGTFLSTILTSATLLRCPSGLAAIAPDIKVKVYLSGGKLFEGEVSAYDFHYNIATIKIRSDAPLSTAILRHFDDSMVVNPSALCGPGDMVDNSSSFQLWRHVNKTSDSNLFKLCPGGRVVALGRHYLSHKLMVAPGEFSGGESCYFDCKELSRVNCKISISGIGGPLINYYGEVIGINFCAELYTPFLPIKIASKCLEHVKRYGRVLPPWPGLVVINLYEASLAKLEKIVEKFPCIREGVMVEQVKYGSSAHSAGISCDDIIVQCDGNFVRGSSELVGIMWDKAGESLDVVLLRASTGDSLKLTLHADKTGPDIYHRWPVPKRRRVSVGKIQ